MGNSKEDLIMKYHREGYKYEEIVNILFSQHKIVISIRHLKRILKTLNLKRRNIIESSLETIVEAVVTELTESGSCLGYKSLWRRLQTIYDLSVKRETIWKILKVADPEGVECRGKRRLRRRKYKVPGPNFLWHLDGYDKLKPFGFAIHGCIDGFSRKVLWLEVANSNNKPESISHYYLNAVKKIGFLPTLLRSDAGTENVLIASLQICLRMNHTDSLCGHKSYIKKRSTSNQRIESYWSQLRKSCLDFWISFFKDIRDKNIFDDSKQIHVECLRYCFGALIKHDLEMAKKEWNRHSIRKQKLSELYYERPNFLFYSPQTFNTENYGKAVNNQDIDICLNNFSLTPQICNPLFHELRLLLSPDTIQPTTIEKALQLYIELLHSIDKFEDNNKETSR